MHINHCRHFSVRLYVLSHMFIRILMHLQINSRFICHEHLTSKLLLTINSMLVLWNTFFLLLLNWIITFALQIHALDEIYLITKFDIYGRNLHFLSYFCIQYPFSILTMEKAEYISSILRIKHSKNRSPSFGYWLF